MNYPYRQLGVWALFLVLALAASACTTVFKPPPEAARAFEPEVRPILEVISGALSEQGYDTARIGAWPSVPVGSYRGVHIDSQVDTVEWDSFFAVDDACLVESDAVSSYCVEETLATTAISSATKSLRLAGYDCDHGYNDRYMVECWTRHWKITLSYRPGTIVGGHGKWAAMLWVRVNGHSCWRHHNVETC
jgi:hypothetical protein